MKITVTNVGKGWLPPNAQPDADPLYSLVVEGMGEPIKTYDKALAVLGEHEAEEYTAKSGKTYWRLPKARTFPPQFPVKGGVKEFKADPAKMKQEFSLEVARNQSIQRQVALKAAVELTIADGTGIPTEVVTEYFNHFMGLLATPWQPTEDMTAEEFDQVVEEAGDFKKINPVDDDLPPLSAYEELS